jgi:hypothetical protein
LIRVHSRLPISVAASPRWAFVVSFAQPGNVDFPGSSLLSFSSVQVPDHSGTSHLIPQKMPVFPHFPAKTIALPTSRFRQNVDSFPWDLALGNSFVLSALPALRSLVVPPCLRRGTGERGALVITPRERLYLQKKNLLFARLPRLRIRPALHFLRSLLPISSIAFQRSAFFYPSTIRISAPSFESGWVPSIVVGSNGWKESCLRGAILRGGP